MISNEVKVGICIVICIMVIILAPLAKNTVAGQDPPKKLPTTIRQVDHLMVQVPDPGRLHQFFTNDLGLPVAWPMADYGPFSTGGVSFGNVNLELLHSSDEMRRQGLVPEGNGIVGVAFQPLEPLEPTVKVLDAYQVPHGAIIPFTIPGNGTPSTLWNNLELSGIMPGSMIFYCEYTFKQDVFRSKMKSALDSSNGGPLGITGLAEIIIHYNESKVLENWQFLLSSLNESETHILNGGNGVTVRLIKSDKNRISSLLISVKSLGRARSVLEEIGIFDSEDSSRNSIKPDAISGLQISLSERVK